MIIFIAIFILAVSFLGMAVIARRKIKTLKNTEARRFSREAFWKRKQEIGQKIQRVREIIKPKLGDLVLEKVVSRIKVMAMKTENKCNQMLEAKRARTKKRIENKGYWQKLKNLKSRKKEKNLP